MEIILFKNGKIAEQYDEKLKEYMEWGSIEIEINLKLGNDAFKCYTCDFTHDYIDINANYRNQNMIKYNLKWPIITNLKAGFQTQENLKN